MDRYRRIYIYVHVFSIPTRDDPQLSSYFQGLETSNKKNSSATQSEVKIKKNGAQTKFKIRLSVDQKVRWYKSWLVQQHCFSMPLSVSCVLVIFFSVGSDWWSRTAGKAMSAPRCHDGVLTDPMLIHHNFLHFVLVYISNYKWHYMTLYIIDEWIHIDTRYSGYFRLATPGSHKLLGSFQVQPIPLHFDHDRQDQGMDGISQII